MMHEYTKYILIAILLLLLLGTLFTVQRNGFSTPANDVHEEGVTTIETREISVEEFIEMTTETPEEADELRRVLNSQN